MSSEGFCSSCGDTLKHTVSWDISTDGEVFIQVIIEPCDTCLATSDSEGFDRGYAEGLEDKETEMTSRIEEIAVSMYKEVEDSHA
jgi:hypothetical protein